MKIQIEAPFSVNPYLEEVINKQIGKMATYQSNLIHADVFLKLKDHAGTDDKVAEVRLRKRGPDIFAESSADSFEKAIAACADKLKKQLLKAKPR